MYCSSCGTEVTQELNYCNRCGANLNPPANLVQQAPPVSLTGPTIALGATVVLCLAAVFGGIDNLAARGVHPTAIAWIAIISLTLIFGVAALFVRLWMSLLAQSKDRAVQQPQPPQPAQLKKHTQAAQLPSPQTGPMTPPVSSVTDHTTRTFEPVYREREK